MVFSIVWGLETGHAVSCHREEGEQGGSLTVLALCLVIIDKSLTSLHVFFAPLTLLAYSTQHVVGPYINLASWITFPSSIT